MNDKPKPIAADDWISQHLARQQSDAAEYGELLVLGGDAMNVKSDPACSEWLALKLKDQEDLQVERMPWEDETYVVPEDIPYPYGG